MPRNWIACALLTMTTALPAAAQTPADDTLSALQIALACAPAPRTSMPAPTPLRIAGGQETFPRIVFGSQDHVVITGGTAAGVARGQRYAVRTAHLPNGGSLSPQSPHVNATRGWVRIVAVNDTTAIASVEHACSAIAVDDYLEPFTVPQVPATLLEAPADRRDLDFTAPARVVFGDDERTSVATGEFVLLDRGASSGITAGSRLAIYRDIHAADVPLASIGDAVVVSEGPDVAVARIVRARDAVYSGDYLVPEKK